MPSSCDYRRQGFTLTLRQVYYQLVTKSTIENTGRSYKNLGVLVSSGRLAGLIDCEAIDRTRFVRALDHWDKPQDIIETAAASFRVDLWADQPYYVEVWIEKDALIDIVETVSHEYDVPCFSCRGYGSSSEYWRAAQRFQRHGEQGQECIILHLGDHDPSGLDMTRDIGARLTLFGAPVTVWHPVRLVQIPTGLVRRRCNG